LATWDEDRVPPSEIVAKIYEAMVSARRY
jgi:hypothetical protein